jgi:WD40 repeat protein
VATTMWSNGRKRVLGVGHSNRAQMGHSWRAPRRDGTVRVWDATHGRCLAVLEGHTYHVQSVAWSDDEHYALSCSTDIRMWDLERCICMRVLEGHAKTIRSVQWSADQNQLLSASYDATARIWDAQTGHCLKILDGHHFGLVNAVWSSDSSSVIACDWKGHIAVWRLMDSLDAGFPCSTPMCRITGL